MTSTVRKAVIPAAGLGTRFLPVTKSQPKEMLPVVDKPSIQYVVEEAVRAGLTDILIITGRGKRAIEDHFDRNFELEFYLEQGKKHEELEQVQAISEMADIHYIRQRDPLGLGHAVSVARQHVGSEPFAVLLGDVIIDAEVPCTKQLIDVYETHGPVIALLAVPEDKTQLYGVISGKSVRERLYHVDKLVEKPAPGTAPSNLSVLGRYVLPPSIFDILERTPPGKGGEIQLTDALDALAREGKLYGLETTGTLYDAGDRLGYIEATVAYALKRPELAKELRPVLRRLLGS